MLTDCVELCRNSSWRRAIVNFRRFRYTELLIQNDLLLNPTHEKEFHTKTIDFYLINIDMQFALSLFLSDAVKSSRVIYNTQKIKSYKDL